MLVQYYVRDACILSLYILYNIYIYLFRKHVVSHHCSPTSYLLIYETLKKQHVVPSESASYLFTLNCLSGS